MKITKENLAKLRKKKWRLHNLYKIVNREGVLVRFAPNKIQHEYLLTRWLRNIILKGRQLGITTMACIDLLDDSLWNKNFTCVIIAHEEKAMEAIFAKIKTAWEEFEKEFGQAFGFSADTSRSNMLKFNNGSTIKVSLSSRGETVQRLHVSEFGKICAKYPQKAIEIITGAFPSVPEKGRITIESTADGEVGDFHDRFWDAWERGKPQHRKQFKAFFLPWYLLPEYVDNNVTIVVPQNFKEYQKKNNLTDAQIRWYYVTWLEQGAKMKENYPTTPEEAFESSGNKIFNNEALAEHIKVFCKDGEKSGNWTFYETYNPRHRYVLGADPSEGVGRDSSTAHIIDVSWREEGHPCPKVVGVFADNRLQPDIFAYEIKRGASMYGACLVGVERNGTGLATLTQLKQIYPNLYTEQRRGNTEDKETTRLGFLTTASSKPIILFNLATAITEHDIIIPDRATCRELRMYDETHMKRLRFDESISQHLDRVMSLAIAWEMKNFIGPESDFSNGGQYVEEEGGFDRHAGMEI